MASLDPFWPPGALGPFWGVIFEIFVVFSRIRRVTPGFSFSRPKGEALGGLGDRHWGNAAGLGFAPHVKPEWEAEKLWV